MKKITNILTALFLLTVISSAQPHVMATLEDEVSKFNTTVQSENIVEIKTDIYEAIYNIEYQQPLMVDYTIFCRPESPTHERDGISFKAYPGLKGSSSSDYSGNVYDLNTATKQGIIYPPLDPAIFEVKFLNKDIKGRVVNY